MESQVAAAGSSSGQWELASGVDRPGLGLRFTVTGPAGEGRLACRWEPGGDVSDSEAEGA